MKSGKIGPSTAQFNQTVQTGGESVSAPAPKKISDPQLALPNPRPVGQLCLPNPNVGDYKRLDAEQIKMVSGVGGADIRGPGILTGIVGTMSMREVNFGIATQVEKAVLITANAGRDNQVQFTIDLDQSKAAELLGQKVSIEGQINKQTDTAGKIEGASLKKVGGFPMGTYTQVSGTVQDRQNIGIGGEAPPSGHWLVLDTPITVASQSVTELFVDRANVKDGQQVKLNGRLDAGSYGGVETPRSSYVQMSGVSNVGAGEPSFDGRDYTSSVSGKPLDVVAWNRPQMYDAPATIWVLDPGQDKAFEGASGGMRPQNMNSFHGFRSAHAMVPPTAAEVASIQWRGDTPFDAVSLKKLDLIHSDEMPDGVADGMSSSWYRNEDTNTLYRFNEGGIAGFVHSMDQIIRPEAQ